MRDILQHYLNPLHVYCRMRDIGIGRSHAILFCRYYERVMFKQFTAHR